MEIIQRSVLEDLEHLKRAGKLAGVEPPEWIVPQECWAELGDLKFHYVDWGREAAPVVLLLHGGGLTARSWDLVALCLRDRFHCIALDQRGHGDSDWAPDLDYRIDTQVEDLKRFIDHLKLKEVTLVGMSLGGQNSMAYAARYGDNVRSVVLVDVGPDIQRAGVNRIREFGRATTESTLEGFIEEALKFNPARDRNLLRRSLLHNLRPVGGGRYVWKYDRRQQGRLGETLEERSRRLWRDVAAITCPTLVVRGDRSDVFSRQDAEKLTRHLRKGEFVEVPNAGHTVQGDNPAGLLAGISGFLDRTAGS